MLAEYVSIVAIKKWERDGKCFAVSKRPISDSLPRIPCILPACTILGNSMKDFPLPPVKPIPVFGVGLDASRSNGAAAFQRRGVIGGMIHTPLEGVGRQLEGSWKGSWKDPWLVLGLSLVSTGCGNSRKS
jgi:hypothetical protein